MVCIIPVLNERKVMYTFILLESVSIYHVTYSLKIAGKPQNLTINCHLAVP